MHKVSRSLLTAGFMALGVLAAACGSDTSPIVTPPSTTTSTPITVTLTPTTATIPAGSTITLFASVAADAAVAKTVTWSTSSAAVATVDATGKVTGVAAGVATITATSTADASKGAASFITVTAVAAQTPPTISIASVTDLATNNPVNLSNVAGQINVTVNTSGGGQVDLYVSSSCASNTIAAGDVAAATQQTSAAQAGQVTLSINTASLTSANVPRWANGNYCIKAQLTSGAQKIVATNQTALTLNNANRFIASAGPVFTTQTGGPTSAVSTINGLNYNQGNLAIVVTPVIFTSASPAALISGTFTRNGEQNGGASLGSVAFTNLAVASATNSVSVTMTDTGTTATGVRSIVNYTSLAAGDTLYITSITDAAGNPITVAGTGPGGSLAVAGAQGIRIDNDAPTLGGNYTVTAANGYVGAAYSFASGTTGAAASDTRAGVPGVGFASSNSAAAGTTYYAGTPGPGTAFATANSCSVAGLAPVTTGNDLAPTSAITPYAAKVVVQDQLGNKRCTDISTTGAASTGVTQNTGLSSTFGVDKAPPTIAFVPPTPANAPSSFSNNNGASDLTAYAATKNFSLNYQDDISGFTNGFVVTPLKGTLTRNSFAANSASSAANCVLGTYTASSGACADVSITPTSSVPNTAPFQVNSIEITNGTATPGYYMLTVNATDLALNTSGKISRLVAFDNVAPAISALTQSPATVAGNATVTVTGAATDNLDLAASTGRLSYGANVALPLQSVTGTSFGPNFDATLVTAASASVALANVYRGVQTTTAGGVINGDRATGVPSATITVTDVAANATTSAPLTIALSGTPANILNTAPVCSGTPNTFIGTPTNPAPGARAATTTITANLTGSVCDPTFQSQPLAQVDFYKSNGTELVLVGSTTAPITTDAGAARSYSYQLIGTALTGGATNTFYAIGRNAAGDAIVTQAITVVNP